jgi:cation-transporting P-type ATPase E
MPSTADRAGGIRPLASHPGLSDVEVAERVRLGQVNDLPDDTSRRVVDILRANVFTRFNAIISALVVVVFAVGSPIDATFGVVMVLNAAIGIVQELRAKRTLDRLRVLLSPTATVVRSRGRLRLAHDQLVLDDVLILVAGDQVPVDAIVIESNNVEVDESALTGEADPVHKTIGDEVLSGSNVVAGRAVARAVRVGDKAFIHRLVAEAKQFALAESELRVGVDRILRVVTFSIVPLAALLLWSQLRANNGVSDALVAAVAGVVGLVPQGLVLLVSLAMAVAIIRLARSQVVVQELYAVEGLARIDTLCIDKTGTLTTGRFTVDEIMPFGAQATDLHDAIAALAASEPSPTSTMQVLASTLLPSAGWRPVAQVAFSSERKWSGTTFEGHGTWLMGAPEVLLGAVAAPTVAQIASSIKVRTEEAKRVLLVAHTAERLDGIGLPHLLEPVGLIVLSEQIREDAADTVAYFARQHVDIKVISGDSPSTVAAVARRLGIAGADNPIDLRTVTGAFDEIVQSASVFGRVRPEQKRELVDALQRAGHVVAMTGDGVNDIPALKLADIGIAMDTATPATKAVAQVVLLDGRFEHLPTVVAEGRRVVANMERVSSLFVTKSVYAAVFAVAIGLSGAAFPFLPRHMSLVADLTVGLPAFVLSFRASDRPCQAGYLRRVVQFAVPAGLVAAIVTLGSYWLARSPVIDASLKQARSASTFALVSIAFWVLYRLMRPIDRFQLLLLLGLGGLFALVLVTPFIRHFYALEFPPVEDAALTAGVTWGSIVVLEALLRRFGTGRLSTL